MFNILLIIICLCFLLKGIDLIFEVPYLSIYLVNVAPMLIFYACHSLSPSGIGKIITIFVSMGSVLLVTLAGQDPVQCASEKSEENSYKDTIVMDGFFGL